MNGESDEGRRGGEGKRRGEREEEGHLTRALHLLHFTPPSMPPNWTKGGAPAPNPWHQWIGFFFSNVNFPRSPKPAPQPL